MHRILRIVTQPRIGPVSHLFQNGHQKRLAPFLKKSYDLPISFSRSIKLRPSSNMHSELKSLYDSYLTKGSPSIVTVAEKASEIIKKKNDGIFRNIKMPTIIREAAKLSHQEYDYVVSLMLNAISNYDIPDTYTCTAIIAGYTDQSRIDKVIEFTKLFKSLHIKFEEDTYNVLIHAHGKLGIYEDAINLYQAMTKAGIRPSETTYTILMGVCSSVKQYSQMYEIAKKCMVDIEADVQKAVLLLPEKMPKRDVIVALAKKKGNPPSVSELVEKYQIGKFQHQLDNYLKILAEASRQRTYVFNALLIALAEKQDLASADSTLRFMENSGIMFDAYTFTNMMLCCQHCNDAEEVLRYFDFFTSKGVQPNQLTYSALIHALSVKGAYASAEKFFVEAESKFELDVVTWGCRLRNNQLQGQFDEFSKNLNKFLQTNLKVSYQLFTIVASHFLDLKWPDPVQMEKIFDELQKRAENPDEVVSTITAGELVRKFSELRRMDLCLKYYNIWKKGSSDVTSPYLSSMVAAILNSMQHTADHHLAQKEFILQLFKDFPTYYEIDPVGAQHWEKIAQYEQ